MFSSRAYFLFINGVIMKLKITAIRINWKTWLPRIKLFCLDKHIIIVPFKLSLWMAPPLQYSCLENPMDGGAWWAAVHGIAMSQTWLSDFTFTFHFHALEKEMATHSSILAWRIPGTGEPGGLSSMGWHGVRHDWSDLAAAAAAWNKHCLSRPSSPEN